MSTSGHCTQCTAKGFKARSMQCKIIVYFREFYTKYSQSTCKALYNYLLQGTVHSTESVYMESGHWFVSVYNDDGEPQPVEIMVDNLPPSGFYLFFVLYVYLVYVLYRYLSIYLSIYRCPLRYWSTASGIIFLYTYM